MLTRLHIRNYTLIDHLELDFGPGFSALTGETGAGKSILIDALGLLLGDRARADLIRAGAGRAELSAEFDLRDLPAAAHWLAEEGLDDGEVCVLRRVLQRDGGSRMTINGRPVTAQSLRHLGPLLIEIHGQHAHQSLLQGSALVKLVGQAQQFDKQVAPQLHWVVKIVQGAPQQPHQLVVTQVVHSGRLGWEQDSKRRLGLSLLAWVTVTPTTTRHRMVRTWPESAE